MQLILWTYQTKEEVNLAWG
ncbi:rCG22586 [Rattus norvegicus]|uniref:RCG22586 n=1 Tax=Rattus norvegicus TaxID=10116 RepID=A6IN87_RAT|nr:rCG22586 [Rattus norvegicus]